MRRGSVGHTAGGCNAGRGVHTFHLNAHSLVDVVALEITHFRGLFQAKPMVLPLRGEHILWVDMVVVAHGPIKVATSHDWTNS